MSSDPAPTVANVASILLPALVAGPLHTLAQQTAQTRGHCESAARDERVLQALTGRLLTPGGWRAGSRQAGAEPLCTHRARPYDESTVRKAARELSAAGAVQKAETLLEEQVHQAVASRSVTAYTDIYDQVYWTKKPAHAGPVGGLGNRRLGATYFGLTFVQPTPGLCLAYHVSWHKPASPLIDSLEALDEKPERHRWLTVHVELHVLDRGTQGNPTLTWALEHQIPYLTLSNGAWWWRRYHHPTHQTITAVPIFVRPDERLNHVRILPTARVPAPQTILFPAQPDQGEACGRAILYRTAATLRDAQIETLDEVYKARWPNNEHPIKALIAVGFGHNRDRTLERTTSRGQDGEQKRLQTAIESLTIQMHALERQPLRIAVNPYLKRAKKRKANEEKLAVLQAKPVTQSARSAQGGELLCKVLTLLLYNALALLLWRSPLSDVRTMTPARVADLLLRRSTQVIRTQGRMTLVIEAMVEPSDQIHQDELVRLVNAKRLEVHAARIILRIRDPAQEIRPLRVAA